MTLTLLDTGVGVQYKRRVLDFLAVDKIEDKVRNLYSNKNAKPIISSFPDLKSIIVPEANLQIMARENRLSVDLQLATTDLDIIDKTFLALSADIFNVGAINAKSYAFRFSLVYSAPQEEMIHTMSDLQASAGLRAKVPKDATLLYVLPEVLFSLDGKFYNIKFELEMPEPEDVNSKPYLLNIESSAIFRAGQEMTFETLKNQYSAAQAIITTYIKEILTNKKGTEE